MGCEIRLSAPRPPKCKVASFLANYALKWPVGVLRAFLIDADALLPLAECLVALSSGGYRIAGRRPEISGAGGWRRNGSVLGVHPLGRDLVNDHSCTRRA
jgi:hypothetical protein